MSGPLNERRGRRILHPETLPEDIVRIAVQKVKTIPRQQTLQPNDKIATEKRPVTRLLYHPSTKRVRKIIQSNLIFLQSHVELAAIFNQPPQDMLVRSKLRQPATRAPGTTPCNLSLAGAATSIIFVSIKVLSRQTCVLPGLSRENMPFVVTKIWLSQQNTNILLSVQKDFVATKPLSRQKTCFVLSRQKLCLWQLPPMIVIKQNVEHVLSSAPTPMLLA